MTLCHKFLKKSRPPLEPEALGGVVMALGDESRKSQRTEAPMAAVSLTVGAAAEVYVVVFFYPETSDNMASKLQHNTLSVCLCVCV